MQTAEAISEDITQFRFDSSIEASEAIVFALWFSEHRQLFVMCKQSTQHICRIINTSIVYIVPKYIVVYRRVQNANKPKGCRITNFSPIQWFRWGVYGET